MRLRLGAVLVIPMISGSVIACSGAPEAASDKAASPVVPSANTIEPIETSGATNSPSVPKVSPGDAIQAACLQLENLPEWSQIVELEPLSSDPYYAEELLLWGDSASEGYVEILTGIQQLDTGESASVAALTREIEIRQRAASDLSSDARFFLESPSQARYRILLMGFGGFLRSIEIEPRECSELM